MGSIKFPNGASNICADADRDLHFHRRNGRSAVIVRGRKRLGRGGAVIVRSGCKTSISNAVENVRSATLLNLDAHM